MTGSAVPGQTGAEADVAFGGGSTVAPETGGPPKATAAPETVAVEQTVSKGEAEVVPVGSQPEAAPEQPGVKGHQTGKTGAHESAVGSTGNGGGAKGQGAKPDCGPSGVPNGQWMKIPRPGYNAGAGAAAGTHTKGYGAGAGGYPNGGAGRAPKPGYGAGVGGFVPGVPGLGNGYGAGFGNPYAGKPQQPIYGQGAYLGAGYGNGNAYGGGAHSKDNAGQAEAGKPKPGYGNGYGAGVQPDYANLGQGVHAGEGKSGGARQMPYNGAPIVPAGLDGTSQVDPQAAALGPNGKLGSMYGGMGTLPFGGQTLGMNTEKSQAKYGIGGLQFGGHPLGFGPPAAGTYGYGGSPYGPAGEGKPHGKYGGPGAGGGYGYGEIPHGGLGTNEKSAGKYGYGRMPYEAQTLGLGPEGKYGVAGSPYEPEQVGLGQNGKLPGKYGGGGAPYAPQGLGFGGQGIPAGAYVDQGAYKSQPLESGPVGEIDTAALPYEPLPVDPETAGTSHGEEKAPAITVEGEGTADARYENAGYINGHMQPEVVAFPAAQTLSPALAHPSAYVPDASFLPDTPQVADGQDLPDPVGTASLDLAPGPAAQTQATPLMFEQPDGLQTQQLPRQIHIQQHLKLHFHPRGGKDSKYDLNGFFGNSGYQG
ncbi:uncharacterized protein LOC143002062 [Genypterus blacodes]|uniref:uncharacterized protein LOC143002062 n=1 Tax=Genypterus blacodes TaxID=154954 RepID=UPI003F762283